MMDLYQKYTLTLKEKIELEICFNNIENDILKHIMFLIRKMDDPRKLHNTIIKSLTYDKVKKKYSKHKILEKINFEACFIKLLGDKVNNIMFYYKLES